MADAQAESPPAVLAFAASDPSGGAGLQADLLTLASMGCHPLSVVTALTVQDTAGVENILPIDSDWVADQARCLLEDVRIDAIKIGVLGSVENIAAIAEIVSLAVQYTLEAVNKGMEMPLAEGLFLEATLFSVACATEDKKEGTSAFLEKRAAAFKGK